MAWKFVRCQCRCLWYEQTCSGVVAVSIVLLAIHVQETIPHLKVGHYFGCWSFPIGIHVCGVLTLLLDGKQVNAGF